MKRHLAVAAAGLTVLSLLAGCSDDKKTVQLPDGVTLPGGATLPGDGASPGNTNLGSCHVKIDGDVTADWTLGQDASSFGYGPWIPQAPGVTAPIVLDETYFVLNCPGDGQNTLSFMANLESAIPMQPATYTIPAATNAFGTAETGMVSILLRLDGPAGQTNWGPSADGQLVITEFDSNHIAGTFTVPITDVLAKLNGTSMGDAVITGEFSYSNLDA